MFRAVLKESVEGCGVSFSDFLASKRYRGALQNFRGLQARYPRNSELGALLWAGPLEAGSLLHQLPYPEVIERARDIEHRWEYNPEVLAGIEAFGTLLLGKARDCLPDRMLEPRSQLTEKLSEPTRAAKSLHRKPLLPPELAEEVKGVHFPTPPSKRKEVSLLKIAKSWSSLSSRERHEVGYLMANLFRSREKITAEEDALDQPRERVLPGLYGKWIPEEANRANCCGKAQLVAGFSRWANAKARFAVPLLAFDQLKAQVISDIADAVMRFCEGSGVRFRDVTNESLKELAGYRAREDKEPSLIHGSVVLQNRGNEWIISDPNLHVSGVLSPHWKFPEVDALLTRVAPVLPGFAYTGRDENLFAEMKSLETLSLANCHRVKSLILKVQSRAHTREEIVDLLAKSEALPLLTSIPEVAQDLPRTASARKKAICALLQFAPDDEERVSEYDRYRKVWFVFVEDPEDEMLKGIRDGADALLLLQRLVAKFCTYGITTLGRKADRSFGGGTLCHPVLEFSNLEWGLAVSTLSHVAIDMGLSDECETELCWHTFRENQLRCCAGRSLRSESEPDELENSAHRALRSIPCVSRSAELVLEALALQ